MGNEVSTRAVHLGQIDAQCEKTPDGAFLVSARQTLPPFPKTLMNLLEQWAQSAPDRTFLADRHPSTDASGWRHLSFSQAWSSANAIGQGLLDRQLSTERPVLILSGNSIEHGQMALGCQMAGIAYSPVSPAYSLRDKSYAKLKHIFDLLTPSLVFVDDLAPFAPALRACLPKGVEVICARDSDGALAQEFGATSYDQLLATPPRSGIKAAYDALDGDTIAKFLFTSGSTGLPKAVINTHKMMACNQVMIANAMAFLADEPPVLVDWLPWNHTAGGNHNFGIALFNGGTLYIDEGKPVPGAFQSTIKNLTDIAPNVYFGVPKSYEMLVDALNQNEKLRKKFFSNILVIQYAGAGLSQHVWEELERLAVQTVGEKILIMTGYGATETSPFSFTTTGPVPGAGYVGVPSPGLQIKLVPTDDKLAVHVRGASITPGYWRMPEATASSFDDEGYYNMGDALKFADPDDASKGFLFDGRVSEDFKLATGTWVNMGKIRTQLIVAMAPYVRDAVITGLDRNEIGAMVFLDIDAVRRNLPELGSGADQLSDTEIASHPALRAKIQTAFNEMAKTATGSSTRVARLLILDQPPSLEQGEVTDKGSINQRVIMSVRSELVEKLYQDSAPERTNHAQPMPDEVMISH